MSKNKITLNRPLVGIIALVCLCAFVGLWFAGDETSENPKLWAAAFGRVGLLMGALWLALPTRDRPAAWAEVSSNTFLGLVLAVIGIAWRPKVAIPVVVVLGILALVLKPRDKYRPPRQ